MHQLGGSVLGYLGWSHSRVGRELAGSWRVVGRGWVPGASAGLAGLLHEEQQASLGFSTWWAQGCKEHPERADSKGRTGALEDSVRVVSATILRLSPDSRGRKIGSTSCWEKQQN